MGRFMSVLCGKHTTEIALLVTHLPLGLCWENNTKSERRKTCALNWCIGHISEGLFFPSNPVRNLEHADKVPYLDLWIYGISGKVKMLGSPLQQAVSDGGIPDECHQGSQAWVECKGALLLFNRSEGQLREATTGSVGEQTDAGLWGSAPTNSRDSWKALREYLLVAMVMLSFSCPCCQRVSLFPVPRGLSWCSCGFFQKPSRQNSCSEALH